MNAKTREQQEAKTELKELIKPGDTVYTLLRHCAPSGMTRYIDVYVFCDNEPRRITWSVGKAVGITYDRKRESLKVGGCGMDIGFQVVYELAHALYGDGYACLGKGKCPSNYHSNHRNSVYCPGVKVGDGEYLHCYRADEEDGFTMRKKIQGEWITLSSRPHIIDQNGHKSICPTCDGNGTIPNPEGPERFDLTHKDGYALKHRWM